MSKAACRRTLVRVRVLAMVAVVATAPAAQEPVQATEIRAAVIVYGGASHDVVTEVCHVIEGAATLVTGGTLVDPVVRDASAGVVVTINGPGVSGSSIEGGVRRRIEKGDVVIIPAGTPHWFPEVEDDITYTVVRIDPTQVVALQ